MQRSCISIWLFYLWMQTFTECQYAADILEKICKSQFYCQLRGEQSIDNHNLHRQFLHWVISFLTFLWTNTSILLRPFSPTIAVRVLQRFYNLSRNHLVIESCIRSPVEFYKHRWRAIFGPRTIVHWSLY